MEKIIKGCWESLQLFPEWAIVVATCLMVALVILLLKYLGSDHFLEWRLRLESRRISKEILAQDNPEKLVDRVRRFSPGA